jgi:hypothetical protein
MATLYVDSGYVIDSYVQEGIEAVWGQARIFIPRSELTLVQSSPSFIYNLDLNTLRLTLKDLEDDEEGIVFVDTHNHVAPITVGGVTLARVIEIINSYILEFEDGQYSVNLLNANSNVADKVVPNQVSVRSANSAGLVTGADGLPTTEELIAALYAAAASIPVPANVKQMNDANVIGTGTAGDDWRGVGVAPMP